MGRGPGPGVEGAVGEGQGVAGVPVVEEPIHLDPVGDVGGLDGGGGRAGGGGRSVLRRGQGGEEHTEDESQRPGQPGRWGRTHDPIMAESWP